MQEEYVQKTGLVATALSFSDEQKKEVCQRHSFLLFLLIIISFLGGGLGGELDTERWWFANFF